MIDLREYPRPIIKLAGAVVINAMQEAARGDLDALGWLILDSPLWLDELDISPPNFLHWLDAGCPLTFVQAAASEDT